MPESVMVLVVYVPMALWVTGMSVNAPFNAQRFWTNLCFHPNISLAYFNKSLSSQIMHAVQTCSPLKMYDKL